ncbi:MAG: DUF1592 domain-containing protein, partial [Bdellovibrionia bacterium]
YSYYDSRKQEDGDRTALKQLFTRFLISPNFLYRTETGKVAKAGEPATLNQFEIASLIAFTLTANTPDDKLLDDATNGALTADAVRGHVRRLLKTTAGRNTVIRFLKQWLKAEAIDDMYRDPERYPKLESAEQAHIFKVEFEMFIKDVLLDGEGSLRAALTENFTYVNRHTAHLYGLTSYSDELKRVTLDKSRRGGILTLASVMAAHGSSSEIDHDRPVQRGTMILNRLLCGEVGIPSGLDVVTAGNQAAAKVPNFYQLTTREQFEIMMQQSDACINCHQTFMPYGYILGNYGALGQFMTEMRGRPINVSVTGVTVGSSKKSYGNPIVFINDLAQDERVYQCFTKQMVRFITGNDDERFEGMARYFHSGFRRKKYNVKELFEDFFAEDFLYRRRAAQ